MKIGSALSFIVTIHPDVLKLKKKKKNWSEMKFDKNFRLFF